MLDSRFKQVMESHFKTQHCPGCSTLVYLKQEQCPICKFDLSSWRSNWFNGFMKAFTEETKPVKKVKTEETYNHVLKIFRHQPQYFDILKKCIATHRREEKKIGIHFEKIGFGSQDVPCEETTLCHLFRDYPQVVNQVYNSRHSKGYVIVNVSEAERAVSDIEDHKFAGYPDGDILIRIQLSSSTVNKLREYAAREFPRWDDNSSIWLIVERAINDFLDKH